MEYSGTKSQNQDENSRNRGQSQNMVHKVPSQINFLGSSAPALGQMPALPYREPFKTEDLGRFKP
jgi:hypothetical protein